MSSVFLVLQSAIVAAIQTAIAPDFVSVNRRRPIPAAQGRGTVVHMGKTQGTEEPIGVICWTTPVSVDCYAKSSADECYAIADGLLCAIWEALAGLTLETGNGPINVTLNPIVEWGYDELDTTIFVATLHLEIKHYTRTESLIAI